jgi:sialate O-acetylesterase
MLKGNLTALLILLVTFSFSQVVLPALFGDNMVLQQKSMVSIWGKDKPNQIIGIASSWNATTATQADDKGNWLVKIKTPEAGGPHTLNIKGSNEIILKEVLIGEVWICSGQSNMEMPLKGFKDQPVNESEQTIAKAANPSIRLFTVGRQPSVTQKDDVSGSWLTVSPETVKDFSAVAYFFGKKIQESINVPIGLIHTSYGASPVEAWMDEQTLSGIKKIELAKEVPKERPQQSPTLLYNGMLHPLQKYSIKGVIWYQGEGNRTNAEEYYTLFSAMIKQWRTQWKQDDLPFYFVQIAPFGNTNAKSNSNSSRAALVREAQLKTMQRIKNTGMVVTLDVGKCNVIHPPEKRLVGERLAYWALAKTYNVKDIEYSGPVLKKVEYDKNGKCIVYFDHSNKGLTSFDKPLSGFEIAGSDKVYYAAKAEIIKGGKLVVSSDSVKDAFSIRYAFEDCPSGSLYNTGGLPASPFSHQKY